MIRERLERLVQIVDEASELELKVLVELVEEKFVSVKPKKKKKKQKRSKKLSKYSDKQVAKAVALKKKGFTQKQIAERTGIKEGCLRNPDWLNDRFKKVGK